MQIHAPTVSHEPAMQDEPWLVRCETARVHDDAPGNVTGASNLEWVFAEDERGVDVGADGVFAGTAKRNRRQTGGRLPGSYSHAFIFRATHRGLAYENP